MRCEENEPCRAVAMGKAREAKVTWAKGANNDASELELEAITHLSVREVPQKDTSLVASFVPYNYCS